MHKILFVDDEPRVLRGLRLALNGQRRHWKMSFVESAEEALDELQRQPFDLVVSDMRMPGMSGAELLARVQESWPDVCRLVLSGHDEFESVLRAVPVAHHFLQKPCPPEELQEAIRRALELRRLLDDSGLAALVARLDHLPTPSSTLLQLHRVLAEPLSDVSDVAEVIETDPALSARVLYLSNSAALARGNPIATISDAVLRIGTRTLKHLVLAADLERGFPTTWDPQLGDPAEMQRHATLTAAIASRLVPGARARETAFMAGLLHDVGRLVLLSQLPGECARAAAVAMADGLPLHEVERRVIGLSHAEVGAYLLGLWRLPYPIVDAVANHHASRGGSRRELDTTGALQLAHALAEEVCPQSTTSGDAEPLDLAWLRRLGVADRLPEWRRMAAELAANQEG